MSAQLLLVLVLSAKLAEGCFPPFIPPPGPPGPPSNCGHCKPEIPKRCQDCSCCNMMDCMLRDLSNKVGCTAKGCQSTCAVPCEKDPRCPFPKPPPDPCGHCERRCEGCSCCNDWDCWLRDMRNKVGCSRDAKDPGCKSTDGCRGRGRGGGQGGGRGGGCCTTKGEEGYCMSCVSGYTCQDDVMRCEPALAMHARGSSQMPAPFVPGLGQNFMRAQGGCIHSCGWGKKK